MERLTRTTGRLVALIAIAAFAVACSDAITEPVELPEITVSADCVPSDNEPDDGAWSYICDSSYDASDLAAFINAGGWGDCYAWGTKVFCYTRD